MALILCIETATEVCSVGLSRDEELLTVKNSTQQYDHAASITLLIEACLHDAGKHMEELEAVAVSSGPGSYTALRVGTAAAKGICFARNIPLLSVSTLQSLALASAGDDDEPETAYCPMIDARRMEVYCALYDRRGREITPPQALILEDKTLQHYLPANTPLVFSGNGAHKARGLLKNQAAAFRPVICNAAHIAPFAQEAFARRAFENVAYYAPLYLKPPNITKPRKLL